MLGFSPSLPSDFLALFKLISLFYQHSRWSMLGIQSNKFTNHLKKHTRAQAGSLLFVWFIFKGLDGGQTPADVTQLCFAGFYTTKLLLVRSSLLQLGCWGNTGRRSDLPITSCMLNDNYLFSARQKEKTVLLSQGATTNKMLRGLLKMFSETLWDRI